MTFRISFFIPYKLENPVFNLNLPPHISNYFILMIFDCFQISTEPSKVHDVSH